MSEKRHFVSFWEFFTLNTICLTVIHLNFIPFQEGCDGTAVLYNTSSISLASSIVVHIFSCKLKNDVSSMGNIKCMMPLVRCNWVIVPINLLASDSHDGKL